MKVGAVAGFHGEALRGLDLRLWRRAGQILSFAMNAKIGLDAPLAGDLRGRSGKQVVYIESADAGALFGRGQFERVLFSYSLSMMPPWEAALEHAAGGIGTVKRK